MGGVRCSLEGAPSSKGAVLNKARNYFRQAGTKLFGRRLSIRPATKPPAQPDIHIRPAPLPPMARADFFLLTAFSRMVRARRFGSWTRQTRSLLAQHWIRVALEVEQPLISVIEGQARIEPRRTWVSFHSLASYRPMVRLRPRSPFGGIAPSTRPFSSMATLSKSGRWR